MGKILITGASGFIGGFLVEEALSRGHDVYACIRKTSNLEFLKDTRIKLFITDLSNKDTIKNSLIESGKFNYVIHNAGLTKTCNKRSFEQVNFQNSKNLLDALIEMKSVPQKFILVSSLAAYGPGDPNSLKPIQISNSPQPVSAYGDSKLKIEQYLQSQNTVPYLIFRPTGVFGPREKDFYTIFKTINNGFETYIGSKEQHLTFIYVKDLVCLFLDALESKVVQKSYFATDLKYYTAIEFNEIIKKALNKKTKVIVFPYFLVRLIATLGEKFSCLFFKNVPTLNIEKFKEISQKNWLCDSSDLERDFAFKPQYSLEDAIQETINWYKKEKLL